jgi:hypothetical protein
MSRTARKARDLAVTGPLLPSGSPSGCYANRLQVLPAVARTFAADYVAARVVVESIQ